MEDMPGSKWRCLGDRLSDAIGPGLDRAELAEVVYAELASYVPFDFACLATTDPASGLITWTSKTRDLGVGDEEFAASEYGEPDVNKFEDLARRRPPVGALHIDTGGNLTACRRHREFMAPRFGFGDELRAVFVSRGISWGALGVYRRQGDQPFSAGDVTQVVGAIGTVAQAIQRSLFRLPSGRDASGVMGEGPAILIVDKSDEVKQSTEAARSAIECLGGWDHGALPAVVLAVVARARTSHAPVTTRSLSDTGTWMSVRAAPLDGGNDEVVVSVEATSRAAISQLALAAHGLTAREEEVALLVLRGLDTDALAAALHLSPHTVQDHLKSIFAKVGVRSRRELTAALVLG